MIILLFLNVYQPWQTSYFILRRDPYILEEYKDASLKTHKQIHFISTIKHVGSIRTSKSKQYAFEVVLHEKSSLLLACDNQILLDEWISAFTVVLKSIKAEREMERKNSLNNKSRNLTGRYFNRFYLI